MSGRIIRGSRRNVSLDIGEKRELQYPLDTSLVLSTNTPNEPIEDTVLNWSTLDSEERVVVTLELSLDEYVALASCVDVGSDIAYGSEAIRLWQIWVRSINAMPFCEQINDCIDNNVSTQVSINNTLLSNGIVNPDKIQPNSNEMNNRFPQSQRDVDTSAPPPACDNDILWGGILELVVRLDEIGRDFLQDVVAFNDRAERIANIIDIVPLFGDIAADIITVFSDISPDLLNAYNAHSSQQVIEDTACALFELVCDECRYPTYQEVYDHYSSAGISGIQDIANISITAIVDYLIGSNNLANLFVWYTMNTSVLFTMYLGGTFLGRRGIKWLGIWQKIGEENPSAAWNVLCDGCTTTIILRLSGDSFANMYIPSVGGQPRGVYDPIFDVINGVSTGQSIETRARFVFTSEVTLRHTRFDYVNSQPATNRNNLIRMYNSLGTMIYSQNTPIVTAEGSYAWTGDMDNVKEVEYITAIAGTSGSSSIVKVRLEH